MRKIDLKQSIGLAVTVENGELVVTDCEFSSHKSYELEYIQNQLLNNEITFAEPIYYKYMRLDTDSLFDKKKTRINEYIIPSNLLGIEYIKTRAVMSPDHNKLIEIHYGGGTLILQKVKRGEVIDVIFTKVKKGQKILVPAGYAMILINTRQQSPLIAGEFMSTDAKNYNVLDDLQGMSYYVIRKNAKQEIVQNPMYRTIPKPRTVKWDEIAKDLKITLKTPLSKQIIRKYDKFDWLFKKESIEI